MEPEIARRCKACGASVRNQAGFCPQCGAAVNTVESGSVPQTDALEVPLNQTMEAVEAQEAPLPAMTIGDAVPVGGAAPVSDAAPMSEAAVVAPSEEIVSSSPPAVIDDDRADGDGGAAAEGEMAATAAPTRRHRVKVAALDAVEGKIAPRVEKLRQASTVVLDEAAEDPGLRFVLVAALLIILSLVLLLLSQILG